MLELNAIKKMHKLNENQTIEIKSSLIKISSITQLKSLTMMSLFNFMKYHKESEQAKI